MKLYQLSDRISYFPAGEQPLSSDVGIVHGDRCDWIFDVGSSDEAAAVINGIEKEKKIVLSHFHRDHTGNLGRISYAQLYCGAYTQGKLQKGIDIKEHETFEDGVKLTIFPMPCPHEKGSIGLEVDEQYAFLGDAVYGKSKNGKAAYNANLLKEMIAVLEKLKAEKFLISHDAAFVRPKEEVIAKLKELYQRRKAGEAYLFLDGGI